MDAFVAGNYGRRSGKHRLPVRRRPVIAGALLLLFALFSLLAVASSVNAAAKPGRPTAKSPVGTATSSKPTFRWSRAARARTYEVRVYRGASLLVKKTGVSKLSWACSKALPTGVALTWKVRARSSGGAGAWSRSLKFTVGSPPSSAKAITAFSIPGQSSSTTIDEAAKTIALTMPHGASVTALVASFTTTGASVKVSGTNQVSGVTAINFSNPVTYTVTAADASTQDYVVTVSVAASPGKALTAFSFQGVVPAVIGVVNEADHTVALTVPHGTGVTALVATFTTTGASVKVSGTPQVSGVTAINFSNPVTYTVTAADATTQDYVVTVTVAANPAKAITAFSIPGQTGATVIDQAGRKIDLTMPYGSSITARVASFSTTGVSVAVAGVPQISGLTVNDFSNPVTYTVTAADASTQDYVVRVTVAAATKAITAFTIAGQSGATVIDQAAKTIAVRMPHGTNVTALAPTVVISGTSVSPASGVARDFTSPVTYTVTAADALTQDYVATVTVAANPAKSITAFSFASLGATGVINEATHTIAVIVPYGTEDTARVASFTTTGASVAVAGATQVSGTTPNDFTDPVTYTVTAADESTQDYVVTVYRIGKTFQGGKIAYILESGDPGYDALVPHGLIAAAADQASDERWSSITRAGIGAAAQGHAIGTGQANTTAIVNQVDGANTCTGGAAYICDHLVLGGYSDWYLPSIEELNRLYDYRGLIGGMVTKRYWSSTENGTDTAWMREFGASSGPFWTPNKWQATGNGVRAVRSF